jgi:hypothetical protein
MLNPSAMSNSLIVLLLLSSVILLEEEFLLVHFKKNCAIESSGYSIKYYLVFWAIKKLYNRPSTAFQLLADQLANICEETANW